MKEEARSSCVLWWCSLARGSCDKEQRACAFTPPDLLVIGVNLVKALNVNYCSTNTDTNNKQKLLVCILCHTACMGFVESKWGLERANLRLVL